MKLTPKQTPDKNEEENKIYKHLNLFPAVSCIFDDEYMYLLLSIGQDIKH